MKKNLFCILIFFSFSLINTSFCIVNNNFSWTQSKYLNGDEFVNEKGLQRRAYVWESSTNPFTELILSWNAFRPKKGRFLFKVSVKHNYWSSWYPMAEWKPNSQQTFVNTRSPFVHAKHVRVELKKGRKATAFKVVAIAENGASLKDLKALFVCLSNESKFSSKNSNLNLPTLRIKNVPRQSQMVVDHPRFRDICSPTSLSMLLGYFGKNLKKSWAFGKDLVGGIKNFVPDFAKKVHDDCYLDIYGNWILNVAQAFDSAKGDVFFRVEKLNDFNELYSYLKRNIPVAVSVRGNLRGAVKSYDNGHFIVVVGWDNQKKAVLCVDPAFPTSLKTARAYRLRDFLNAWGTSRNLSYISIPKQSS